MIGMDRLATLSLFVHIVDRGSFSAAAADCGVSRPAATAAIKALEQRLGTRLLQRSTRHVRPTAEGDAYYRRCVAILADVEDADRGASGAVGGLIRVDVAGHLARTVLLPALPAFLRRHPGLTVHLGEGERFVDLVREGVDCVVRAGDLADSDMVVRRLGMLEEITVASPEYLARHGTPASPAGLAGHEMIGFVSSRTGLPLALEFAHAGEVTEVVLPARVLVGGGDTSAAAARLGLGLAQAPRYRFVDDLASGALVEVLADYPPTPQSVTSTVSVVVSSAASSISVSAAAASVLNSQTDQLTAVVRDQFGNAIATPAGLTWSIDSGGVGSVNPNTGLYTAPANATGSASVRATVGTATGAAIIKIIFNLISGTAGDDVIRLVRSGSLLLAYVNNATTAAYSLTYADLNALTVSAGTGNDTINIDYSGGATPIPAGGLTVDGGTGNNTLIVTGTTGVDTINVGATTASVNYTAMTYANISSVIVNGNGGADSLTQAAQPGKGATLAFNGTTTGGPSTADSLSVLAGTYTFAAPAAGTGINPIFLSSLSVSNSAKVVVATAASTNDRWVLETSFLSMNGTTSTLDLGGNDMIVHNATATAAAQSLIAYTADVTAGQTAGRLWTGSGITSSAAAGNPLMGVGIITNNALFTTFDKQAVVATDTLLKFTFAGDANLSGNVDGSDYSLIDNGYNKRLTGWLNGDFNYDGFVDGSDYTLIDNAFNIQGAPISPSSLIATVTSQIAPKTTAVIPATFQSTRKIVAADSGTTAQSDDVIDRLQIAK